jgi:hypothetical protein
MLAQRFTQLLAKGLIGLLAAGKADDPEGLRHPFLERQMIKRRDEFA